MSDGIIVPALLGIVEGMTEFIPVSSTAHLLLLGEFLGFESAGNTFEVVIQLGAIMALFSVYALRLGAIAVAAPYDPQARRTIAALLLAFAPAVVVGLLAHDFIKAVLFETPTLIAINLIWGGVVLVVIDRIAPRPVLHDAAQMPLGKAFIIGLCQCLAMAPGVSRSGATIVGAVMLRVDKRAAAEFSFLLSLPTMGAAVAYDLYKNWGVLDFTAAGDIAVGFIMAFLTAVLVVRLVLSYVGRYGYALFGWWRIVLGGVVLAVLYI